MEDELGIIYKPEDVVSSENEPCYPNGTMLILKWETNVEHGEIKYTYSSKTKRWSCDSDGKSNAFCVAVIEQWIKIILNSNYEKYYCRWCKKKTINRQGM